MQVSDEVVYIVQGFLLNLLFLAAAGLIPLQFSQQCLELLEFLVELGNLS